MIYADRNLAYRRAATNRRRREQYAARRREQLRQAFEQERRNRIKARRDAFIIKVLKAFTCSALILAGVVTMLAGG